MEKYVGYYRVSTKKQGNSGLGLDGQRTAVANFLKPRQAVEVDSFTEVESGRNGNRPILKKAITRCKETGAKLLIAKLDRLSRNAGFLFTLKDELEDAGVGFTVADLPDANNLTLGIMAVLAQYESELKSERLKAAFSEAKKRGRKLGSPQNLTEKARNKAHRSIAEQARKDTDTRKAFHFIKPRREQGISYAEIAKSLNAEGYRTRRGKLFHPEQVRKIYKRFTKDPQSTMIRRKNGPDPLQKFKQAAEELNDELGLEPQIDITADRETLRAKLQEALPLIDFENDEITEPTLQVIRSLTAK